MFFPCRRNNHTGVKGDRTIKMWPVFMGISLTGSVIPAPLHSKPRLWTLPWLVLPITSRNRAGNFSVIWMEG